MKKKLLAFLSLTPLLLTSCWEGVGNKTFMIDKTVEVSNTYADDTDAYYNHAYYKGWSEIKPQLDLGVNMLIVLTWTDCNHCNLFKDTFVSFAKKHSIAYGVIERQGTSTEGYVDYHDQVDALNEYYSYREGTQDYIRSGTPSVVGANSSKAVEIVGGNATAAFLESSVKKLVSYTNVYRSRALSSVDDSSLQYYLDSSDEVGSSFFKTFIYPTAKKEKKKFNIVDYNLLSEEDKNAFLNKYSLQSYSPVVEYNGESTIIKSDLEEAKSLVNKYLKG